MMKRLVAVAPAMVGELYRRLLLEERQGRGIMQTHTISGKIDDQ